MIENRKEYKFVLNNNETKNFLTIFGDKLNVLHPSRTITSLYFDTVDYQLFNNSKLNDTNKMKVRIRTYNNDAKFYKEIKFNDGLGKRKMITDINISSFMISRAMSPLASPSLMRSIKSRLFFFVRAKQFCSNFAFTRFFLTGEIFGFPYDLRSSFTLPITFFLLLLQKTSLLFSTLS